MIVLWVLVLVVLVMNFCLMDYIRKSKATLDFLIRLNLWSGIVVMFIIIKLAGDLCGWW